VRDISLYQLLWCERHISVSVTMVWETYLWISYYGVRDISLNQLLWCERHISESVTMVWETYPWISYYGVRDISLYQLLWCERHISVSVTMVWDISLYQLLWCERHISVSWGCHVMCRCPLQRWLNNLPVAFGWLTNDSRTQPCLVTQICDCSSIIRAIDWQHKIWRELRPSVHFY
jgi:hypothetical protein